MEICENCGLPAWAVSGLGFKIRIEIGPRKFRRASKRTVWCHDEECAVQTLAVSRYGRRHIAGRLLSHSFGACPRSRNLYGGLRVTKYPRNVLIPQAQKMPKVRN
jgi:hypothetical protein